MAERCLRAGILLLCLPVAFVLMLAGASKLLDPGPALVFFKSGFDIPVAVGVWFVYGLAAAELVLGAALVYGHYRWIWPTVACLLLVGSFVGLLIAVHLRFPHVAIQCGCFGSLQAPVAGKSLLSHLRLDAALAALLLLQLLLWGAARRSRRLQEPGGLRGPAAAGG